MASFAARLKIEYATVSELNSQTSAFCGCFWDPKSNYIIVAFKGTSPTEFVEWAGDFSYEPVDAGDYIRGFGRVHGGFMERMFSRDASSRGQGYLTVSFVLSIHRSTVTILSDLLFP
jgi:hypothetical protein